VQKQKDMSPCRDRPVLPTIGRHIGSIIVLAQYGEVDPHHRRQSAYVG
jgi:hypothetical protein